jgi:hypothetical protein
LLSAKDITEPQANLMLKPKQYELPGPTQEARIFMSPWNPAIITVEPPPVVKPFSKRE